MARELERQWEQKLAEHRRLGEDYARFQHEQPRHLTATDRERIRALAADVPATPMARALVMLESIAGIMFIALVVSRLISMHVSSRREEPPPR